ncbi:Histidinol-phosphatase [hydrothermal vent metagenome]|uniref:histidinol-phosphatase n=1 Tax=hydrothermal vent metagenome TaxID=652676 RepID=A0A1W1B8F4_9ZZZZ
MKVDLHNHTPRCNHATGKEEEYIKAAIKAKTEVFGFSDHAPMDFDQKYRMSFEQMAEYEATIKDLKKEYHSKIDIRLGYEVDYLVGHMDRRVLEADVDYLIGSVHFLDKWGFDNPEFIKEYEDKDIDQIWQKYFETITEMAKTKLFDIVGHIDLIKVFKFMPSRDILEFATPALEAIKDADMSIEINTAGYRKPCAEAYPSKKILKKAYELKIPITFGSDAHAPDQVGFYSNEAETLAKEIGYRECAIYKCRKRELLA